MKEFILDVNGDKIHAAVFEGEQNKVAIFAPGVGIRKSFYYPFLEFLNKNNFTVYTLDYRSVSQSRFLELKDYTLRLIDWVDDLKVLIEHAVTKHKSAHFYYVAHSYGGQIYGFLPTEIFTRTVMITSQNGYWKYYKKRMKLYLFWKFVTPVIMWILGYFPGKKLGLGGDLPKGVVQQWRKWCLSTNYLFDDDKLDWKESYATVRTPILAYAIADDEYGGELAVQSIQKYYAESTIITLKPQDIGVETIGHVGFFRFSRLWQPVVDWLNEN